MNWTIITNYPDPDLEKKWFDFLSASSYPSHYTSPGYFREYFGANENPFAVLVFDGEKIVGAATGLRAGKQIVCGLAVRPQISVAKNADERKIVETLRAAFFELAKNDAELITIFCPEQLSGFVESGFGEKKATGGDEVLILDLTGGAEQVFKGFSQSRRSDLRKAMRENQLQISQMETLEELDELYRIHLDWSERKQLEPETREAMQVFLDEPNYHRIFIARHAEKIVAGSYFRFCPNGLFEYSANNSIPEYRHLRPNDLLVWRALEWACAQNFKQCSLGASHLFLRRFGGELTASYRYRLDRTFLKKHDKKEAVKDLTVKTYRAIPYSARQKLKKIVGRS